MNASRPITFVPFANAGRPTEPADAARADRREREFGVGYGRSSGYASARRYASNWAPPRFRFA